MVVILIQKAYLHFNPIEGPSPHHSTRPDRPTDFKNGPQPAATASSPAGSRIVTTEPRIVISPSSTNPARRRLRVSAVVPSRDAMAFFGSGSRTFTTRCADSPRH